MKKLSEILYGSRIKGTQGKPNIRVGKLRIDSRKVEPGDLFIALRGTVTDGHKFIGKAIEKGARAVVCEDLPGEARENVTYVKVEDSSETLGILASNYFGNPSKKLRLVGVTGTNGKTTIVTLLHELTTKLGYPSARLSTINSKVNNEEYPSTHTTPDPVRINEILAMAVEKGCEFAFMEVSSHAIAQKRIAGLKFTGGVFTNITHDHLDYHKTFRNYLETKKAFFDGLPKHAFALVNLDDKNGKVMLQNTKASKHTYALKKMADFRGAVLENSFIGLHLRFDETELHTGLIGLFNAYNLLAVYATASLLGFENDEVLTSISTLGPAEGRFEVIMSAEGVTGIVDYAHTPDALKNVLETISNIRTKQEQLITVVGAGGDRDKSKRPLFATISGRFSDKVILTSDNPRTEDPESIIADIEKGIGPSESKKFVKVTDRKEAIKTAVLMAGKGDIILVAGKGHEKYQEINGVKQPFDDKELLKQLFQTGT